MSLDISYVGYRNGFPFAFNGPYGTEVPEVWDGVTVDTDGRPTFAGTADQLIGIGTDFPVGLTFQEIVDFFWRRKSFDYSFTGSISRESNLNSSKYVCDVSGSIVTKRDPELDTPESLIGLIGGGNPTNVMFIGNVAGLVSGGGTLLSYDSGGSLISTTTVNLGLRAFLVFTEIYFIDGLYYPRIELEVRPSTGLVGSLYSSPMGLSVSSGEVQQTSAVITIFGIEIPLWVVAFNPTNFNYPGSGSGSFDTSMWWGYGGKFDPATGARI